MLVVDADNLIDAAFLSQTTAFSAAAPAACTIILQHNAANTVMMENCFWDAIAAKQNKRMKSPDRQYRRQGSLHSPPCSFWRRVDGNRSDDLEFLFFTSLDKSKFAELALLITDHIENNPLEPKLNDVPTTRNIQKIQFNVWDVLAMTLRHLLSLAGIKDLQVQFGATAVTIIRYVNLGMDAFLTSLFDHSEARVFWDWSTDAMQAAAAKTLASLDIPNVVATIDGTKLVSQALSNYLDQNSNFNQWTKDINRNMILVWDPHGKIVDTGVNLPGSFHDLASSWWCNIYQHIEPIPDPYLAVYDDAFYTKGSLDGKIVKTKEKYQGEGHVRDEYDNNLPISDSAPNGATMFYLVVGVG